MGSEINRGSDGPCGPSRALQQHPLPHAPCAPLSRNPLGQVTGLSPEDEAKKRTQDQESDADGALKLLPLRIPTEWQVVQVIKEFAGLCLRCISKAFWVCFCGWKRFLPYGVLWRDGPLDTPPGGPV